MSLCEVMVAASVFGVAASAALQVWSQSTAAVVRSERQQQQLVRIHAALERSEARLRQLAAAPAASSCAEARARISQALTPADPDVEQRLRPEGEGLMLELGPAPGRQRLLHPVAYGLCAAEP
jgi:type II secretory pathway pseudopilin PulG